MSLVETKKHIVQGQFYVSEIPGEVISTILGSCVAACLHDPKTRLGGMNHFLLPGSDPNTNRNIKYGAHSMEQLINALLRRGAARNRLEVQLFGGANVVKGLSSIGDQNAAFARDFVQNEGFCLTYADLGGVNGRRLQFSPTTGRAVSVRFDSVPIDIDHHISKSRQPNAVTSGVELF
ncbi:chemotaxis protein CheD [Roseovarius rhodophyticola]|uniref:Probable chemoreceptor glutamine deamidase CheD n=1 Tax=Roseovarius rhodophyticola TaxID=3080827 RepID=A0ABZ2TFY8_9RHOB|nr:chemotaxis protein CheD [Roseovarius sp. W115]MDV2928910.1 chemotaxis protein CheD [Roseovarius sp. W115]